MWMTGFFRDVHYTLRQLCRNPGFSAVAVLSLALGIGVNTAVFSLFNAILLRSLVVPRPQELRVLRWSGSNVRMTSLNDFPDVQGNHMSAHAITHPAFLSLREQSTKLADVFGFQAVDQQQQITAQVRGESFTAAGLMVSDNFFTGLGLNPLIGRPLIANEDFAGSSVAVVISYDWWERHFGFDPAVLGQKIELNGNGFTVVGVLPRGFSGVVPGDPSGFYIPMSAQSPFLYRPLDERFHWFVRVMARLKPGVSEQQLRAALAVAFAREGGPIMEKPSIQLESGRRGFTTEADNYRKPILIMQGVVALVLLVACVNLAGLMAARGAARQHELGLRAALGISRWGLVRQSFTESALLAAIGGGLGVSVSMWGKSELSRLFAGSADGLRYDISLDRNVLYFGVAAALLTALLSGVLPALQASRVDPISGLRSRGAISASRLRVGKLLVIGQICISMVLLTCAGLYARTLLNISHIEMGFNSDQLLIFKVNPGGAGYTDPGRIASFYTQVQESLAVMPGVRKAAFLGYPPLSRGWSGSFRFRDGSSDRAEKMQSLRLPVGEDFFDTMGITIVQGRGLSPTDTKDSPKVIVVNEAFAKQYSRDTNPVGRVVHILTDEWQIVGICRDVKYLSLKEAPLPTVYYPIRQIAYEANLRSNFRSGYFAVLTTLPPKALVNEARRSVAAIDPNVQVADFSTQQDLRDGKIAPERMLAVLCCSLATLALLLCCIGLYGLMAYHVARRTPEFATRMALGASRHNIAKLILRESLLLATAGIALGAPLAFGVTRLIKSQFFGVTPNDPLVLASTATLLTAVSVLAAWVPAHRAERVDPMVALRGE